MKTSLPHRLTNTDRQTQIKGQKTEEKTVKHFLKGHKAIQTIYVNYVYALLVKMYFLT